MFDLGDLLLAVLFLGAWGVSGRAARARLRDLRRQVLDLHERLDEQQRPPPVDGALTAAVDELRERSEARQAALSRLAEDVRSLTDRDTRDRLAGARSPRDLAVGHLRDEGYASIEVTAEEDAAEGTRVRVRALFGDQVRYGHVSVRDGRVVAGDLKVPVTLFP